jgi:hypothetical protein
MPENTEHENLDCMCSACCHIRDGEFPSKSIGIVREFNV